MGVSGFRASETPGTAAIVLDGLLGVKPKVSIWSGPEAHEVTQHVRAGLGNVKGMKYPGICLGKHENGGKCRANGQLLNPLPTNPRSHDLACPGSSDIRSAFMDREERP